MSHIFYQSTNWRKTRKRFIRQNYLCEICLKKGDFTASTLVHHIDPLMEGDHFKNYKKCFNNDNLQALCAQCHKHIHDVPLGEDFIDFNINGELVFLGKGAKTKF